MKKTLYEIQLEHEVKALQAQVAELVEALEKQQVLHEEEVIRYLCAAETFKTRSVGLSYEKDILEGMLRLVGSFPKNEYLQEKEQALVKHTTKEGE